MLASIYKARAETLPGEAKQWKHFRYVNCDFWDIRANLENYIASAKRPYKQHTFVKINDAGVILLGK